MNVIIDLCIVPIGVGVSLSPYVAACCNVARFSVDLVDNWSVLEAPWFVRCWGVGVGGMVAHP